MPILLFTDDAYEIFTSSEKQVKIKYIILDKDEYPFPKEYETNRFTITTLADIREGTFIKDIDYIVYWIFSNYFLKKRQMNFAVQIGNIITKEFPNEIFKKQNSVLLFRIGYIYHER